MRAKEFSKEEAIRTAMEVFWKNGFNATSVQDLVAATRVNRSSLYDTFSDKERLFGLALERYEQDVLGALLADARRQSSGMRSIEWVFEYFLDLASGPGGSAGCFVVNTAIELASQDAELANIVRRAQAALVDHFSLQLERGMADGSVRVPVRPATRGLGLMTSLMGLLVLVRAGYGASELRAVLEDVYFSLSGVVAGELQ